MALHYIYSPGGLGKSSNPWSPHSGSLLVLIPVICTGLPLNCPVAPVLPVSGSLHHQVDVGPEGKEEGRKATGTDSGLVPGGILMRFPELGTLRWFSSDELYLATPSCIGGWPNGFPGTPTLLLGFCTSTLAVTGTVTISYRGLTFSSSESNS